MPKPKKQKEIRGWAIVPNDGEYVDLQPESHYFLFPFKKLAKRYVNKANWRGKIKIVKSIITLLPKLGHQKIVKTLTPNKTR